MSGFKEFQTKRTTAARAVSVVRDGDRVYYSGNAATPRALIEALAQRRDQLHNVQLNHVLLLGPDPLSTLGMEGHFRHNALFVGPADRQAVNDGRADYVPIFLHHIPRLFRQGIIPLDVAMIQVSPPDAHGLMSLGTEVLVSPAAVASARVVIAQVNDQMPRVLGDAFVRIQDVHHIVEASAPLPELPPTAVTDIEKQIASHAANLIEDGSTLQLGIGGIPDTVLSFLAGKKDLGIHTEMVSDSVMHAIEAGVVTGKRKSIHPGKVVLTFALGTKALYQYLDNNPMFEAHPVDHVNNPFVISQNDRMISINSAIEVDLTGQVCADSIGTYIYSGFGGQVDFVRGAAQSKGGRSIIALPSTAKNGRVSRIVASLAPGAGVVTTRADVHTVVTEFGAAELFGKNLSERARALIGIAHPDFRDELRDSAKARKL